jgi:hypothetical protein
MMSERRNRRAGLFASPVLTPHPVSTSEPSGRPHAIARWGARCLDLPARMTKIKGLAANTWLGVCETGRRAADSTVRIAAAGLSTGAFSPAQAKNLASGLAY